MTDYFEITFLKQNFFNERSYRYQTAYSYVIRALHLSVEHK